MKMNETCGENLSRLGFGTMRLPLDESGEIDQKQVEAMVDYAIMNGVNYFDTAYPYHGGKSEISIGKALSKYDRNRFYLADKFPGHQIAETYYPQEIFEEQLKKCGVDYFDFYLLHNVYENSIDIYLDEKWGIIEYFLEQKRLGRIKHLGFSCHGGLPVMERFLREVGDKMEFCQIQLNYVDWTLQQAHEKYDMLTKFNIPVWVMEPLRGGKLCAFDEFSEALLKGCRPDESISAWGMRWLMGLPNVKMVLSGMSNMEQMVDNVRTFSNGRDLTEIERNMLGNLAVKIMNAVPCTACRYCVEGCPKELDIPRLIRYYNDLKYVKGFTVAMQMDSIPEDKMPGACVGCGKCAATCPQKIDVPTVMKDFAQMVPDLPNWAKICEERAAAAKKNN